jgi:hypothetical protein
VIRGEKDTETSPEELRTETELYTKGWDREDGVEVGKYFISTEMTLRTRSLFMCVSFLVLYCIENILERLTGAWIGKS